MSFFRPEALDRLKLLAEPALTGAAALWLGWAGIERIGGQTLIGGLMLLASAGLAGWCLATLARVAVLRRGGRAGAGPGVVEITERRIAFFGPETGGVVSLDNLDTVAAWPDTAGGIGTWELVPDEGRPLTIPADARGADALPDALAALPGFDTLTVMRHLAQPGSRRVVLWRRPGTGPRRLS